ncbi:glutamine synthetase family protein [Streptomyces chartreusis]|uniref:glutamine synthetase family protein n=1 Tax=Streptomyces chartreusis TaxID=1969 RepID=UPI003686D659
MSGHPTDQHSTPGATTGRISVSDLQEAVQNKAITTVRACVPDMIGRLKGKQLSASGFLDRIKAHPDEPDAAPTVSEACAYILATDAKMTPLGSFELTGWDSGFQDLTMAADLGTLRVLPHLPGVAMVHCDAVHPNGTHLEIAPRRILHAQLAQLAELGFDVRVGVESEFVLCKGQQPVVTQNLDYALDYPPALNDFLRDLALALPAAGVPIEAIKTEGAPGQVEITFPYGPAPEACDNYTVYKQTVRHVAKQQGLTATFMSAPFTGVGSGLHLHLSLWHNDQPAFAVVGSNEMPAVMQHSIAGLIAGLPDLAPLYAPTPNSYKRYAAAHSFAPQYMNWGKDNRGCAVRVTGHGNGAHLENRLPGADANPYLAVAATLAAINRGLSEKLTPPKACSGDAYADRESHRVPADLQEASRSFATSNFAKSALGAAVVRHYATAAHVEINEHLRQVTDVERERGFDPG